MIHHVSDTQEGGGAVILAVLPIEQEYMELSEAQRRFFQTAAGRSSPPCRQARPMDFLPPPSLYTATC